MPTISPNLVPTVDPGDLFGRFTTDNTLNVRWLVASDPAYFETLNRPLADVVVRQLILAKAVDALELSLGHATLYPFLTQPQVVTGSEAVDVPPNWIWDLQLAAPKKWEAPRLTKVKRVAGDNAATDGQTGRLRLIFAAVVQGSTAEVSWFSADYEIDSPLTYQRLRLTVVDAAEEADAIVAGEAETVAGFITFRTLDRSDLVTQNFLAAVAPPTDVTDSNGDGLFDSPAVYEIADSAAGGTDVTGDFSQAPLSHGTGLLTDSAWDPIPQLDSDIQSWLVAFNYPFGSDASRTSVDGIAIPAGLFREFNLCVPAGDQPDGDATGLFFPVWISRIERLGTGATLRCFFATYNVTDAAADGSPSTVAVEFATLDLTQTAAPGTVVEITPADDLLLKAGTDDLWQQHFGRGHVVLSSLWDGTDPSVSDFFDAFNVIADSPPDTEYALQATRLSAFGLARVPKYVPTVGQAYALRGSTARRTTPIDPSFDNRYVTEQDQGLGDRTDLEAVAGVTSHPAIDRYGYSGALCHRVVRLIIDQTQLGNDPNFYDVHILPRLTALLGRAPAFGDGWYNGIKFLTYNGDSWQG